MKFSDRCMHALIQILTWLTMTMVLSVGTVYMASMIAADLLVMVATWARTYELRKLAASANIKASLSSLLLRDGKHLYNVQSWFIIQIT